MTTRSIPSRSYCALFPSVIAWAVLVRVTISAYWRAGGDARVGLIGPGVEASHAYERTHRDSLRDTIHLIARYLIDDSE